MLWNVEAQLDLPEAKALVLPRVHSDHNPIMFMSIAGDIPSRVNKPFRLEVAWLIRPDYDSIWTSAWNDNRSFSDGLADIIRNSKTWNMENFGNIFRCKRLLQARIKGLQ